MSFLAGDPAVAETGGLGDNLPFSRDKDKGKGKPSLTNPSKSQPAVGIVTTAGEVLSASGGLLGTVVKGPVDALVGKPVTPAGDVLGDDGQVVGEVQMVDVEQQDETHSNADSGVYGVMEGDNKLDSSEPELPVDPDPVMPSKPGKQDTKPGASDIKTDAPGNKLDASTGSVDPKIWPKQKKGFTGMESVPDRPFADFPGAVVGGERKVVCGGEVVGRLVEGEAKALRGKKVDADGNVLDKAGNVVGKAERWEEEEVPEPEPEVKVDSSVLAGKRVNKAGNVVDKSGMIFGRIVEGDVKRMIGRMCDKEGIVRSEMGDELGKAELVPESEREGLKEGPFAELEGCTVTKEGKVVTPGGDVVGRLVEGDGKKLFGRAVDEDGDVCDKNGNVLGHAERWDEPEVEKRKGPMAGRRVNREGNVVDENGDLIGKLTTGELSICAGKEIDDDGDVVDSKGNIIGHTSLLSDIPPTPEPAESPEEKEKREQMEQDKKLAAQMATCIDQCLDKIRPICKMITQILDKAERTPKEELDEEDVVNKVKPLLEEGSRILSEANGMIRGLDPDGRIAANAKHKTATREATPEEYRLADVLKELTGTVTECIENAKRKVEDMPHAKKELNPLWCLLTEPLFQILAAVGLLLNGVLELVGRLLSGLGLGGLIDSLLGGLGLTRLLENLGLKGVVPALTGKK